MSKPLQRYRRTVYLLLAPFESLRLWLWQRCQTRYRELEFDAAALVVWKLDHRMIEKLAERMKNNRGTKGHADYSDLTEYLLKDIREKFNHNP